MPCEWQLTLASVHDLTSGHMEGGACPPLCEEKETSWVPDPWHETMIFRLRRPWLVVFENVLKEEKINLE